MLGSPFYVIAPLNPVGASRHCHAANECAIVQLALAHMLGGPATCPP